MKICNVAPPWGPCWRYLQRADHHFFQLVAVTLIGRIKNLSLFFKLNVSVLVNLVQSRWSFPFSFCPNLGSISWPIPFSFVMGCGLWVASCLVILLRAHWMSFICFVTSYLTSLLTHKASWIVFEWKKPAAICFLKGCPGLGWTWDIFNFRLFSLSFAAP